MIKRKDDLCILHDIEYLTAESISYNNLITNGYLPQGVSNNLKTVCVMKIENAHGNNEIREVYHFKDWQEAEETLLNNQ